MAKRELTHELTGYPVYLTSGASPIPTDRQGADQGVPQMRSVVLIAHPIAREFHLCTACLPRWIELARSVPDFNEFRMQTRYAGQ
jgi:hypothetical protein